MGLVAITRTFSGQARLLAFDEQASLQSMIAFPQLVLGGTPLGFSNPAGKIVVPLLLCPSDGLSNVMLMSESLLGAAKSRTGTPP